MPGRAGPKPPEPCLRRRHAILGGEDPGPFDFFLPDIGEELYLPCLEALYPKLAPEGIIAADNMVQPEGARPEVRRYRAGLRALSDMQTVLLPIGTGIELSVRWPAGSAKL